MKKIITLMTTFTATIIGLCHSSITLAQSNCISNRYNECQNSQCLIESDISANPNCQRICMDRAKKSCQQNNTVEKDQATEQFDRARCLSQSYDACNTNQCLLKSDISESPNCQRICRERAKKQCQNLS